MPINYVNYEIKVNFLYYYETDKKRKKQHFSWITDLEINVDNIEKIMCAGRARLQVLGRYQLSVPKDQPEQLGRITRHNS